MADGSEVKSICKTLCSLRFKERAVNTDIIIFERIDGALLGLPDIIALKILCDMSSILR